ncbi:MAG: S9 family peptidase [bacterium]|nr:S9 family peptidase [bacterium]
MIDARPALLPLALAALLALPAGAHEPAKPTDPRRFGLMDVFELEWASDPRISPDGERVVYVRNFMDVMSDRRRSNLWIIDSGGGGHRPLTTGLANDASPRWSPDGERLLYTSRADGSTQLYVRWMDSGQTARLTQLTSSPGGLAWSPDGKHIAFSMLARKKPEKFVKLPKKPEGATWAEDAVTIDKVIYRRDGAGFVKDGYRQIFVLSADGGTPRQVTSGAYHHGNRPVWTPDGDALIFSANRHDDWEYDPRNSELYELTLADGSIRALTDRQGPDAAPALSPDGSRVAYLGYDDRYQGYQILRLYVMDRKGGKPKQLAAGLDRSIVAPVWNGAGEGVFFQYTDSGNTKIGYASLDGETEQLAADLGGTSLGRPYASGSFTVAPDGRFAFTHSRPDHPADVAVGRKGEDGTRRLTRLNDDLFSHKEIGPVTEMWVESSHDGRRIQSWVVKPPGFDPAKKYPLILEIHGGPFANYGDRFAAEVQLYAASGYVVLYVNPRGSSGYGEEFGNLIHHAYPGYDYDDLMSSVDALLAKGFVDEDNLFVTGGSGGGVLTAWIVGKTDRFAAAVSAKPVINWYSFALTADMYNMFYKYWFPGFPWDHPEQYLERSPLHHVGNVKTPTMLLTGEEDYRTPMAESEQFYQALKLRKVDSMLVRIPGASHGIARRPSNLMSKVAHILAWFEKYRSQSDG